MAATFAIQTGVSFGQAASNSPTPGSNLSMSYRLPPTLSNGTFPVRSNDSGPFHPFHALDEPTGTIDVSRLAQVASIIPTRFSQNNSLLFLDKSSIHTVAEQLNSHHDAFSDLSQNQTVVTAGGATLTYDITTITSLAALTDLTTIIFPVSTGGDDLRSSESSSSHTPVPIVVGPGGRWWKGLSGAAADIRKICIWPFCHEGGSTFGASVQSQGDNHIDDRKPDIQGPPKAQDGTVKGPADLPKENPKSVEETKSSTDESTLSTSGPSTTVSTSSQSELLSSTTSSTTTSSVATLRACAPSTCTSCKDVLDLREVPKSSGRQPRSPVEQDPTLKKRILRRPVAGEDFVFNIYRDTPLKLQIDRAEHNNGETELYQLLDSAFTVRIGDLYGCTSVIVASEQAVWLSHFWEVPQFIKDIRTLYGPRLPADKQNFKETVLDHIRYGNKDYSEDDNKDGDNGKSDDGVKEQHGLENWTGDGRLFSTTNNPQYVIITPNYPGQPGFLKYPEHVNEIKATIEEIMGGHARSSLIQYEPEDNANKRAFSSAGKVAFDYDPAQVVGQRNSNPQQAAGCQYDQLSAYNLWFEDRPEPILTDIWFSSDKQKGNPQQGGQSQKRDAPANCSLPISKSRSSTSSASTSDEVTSQSQSQNIMATTLLTQTSDTTQSLNSSSFVVSRLSSPSLTNTPTVNLSQFSDASTSTYYQSSSMTTRSRWRFFNMPDPSNLPITAVTTTATSQPEATATTSTSLAETPLIETTSTESPTSSVASPPVDPPPKPEEPKPAPPPAPSPGPLMCAERKDSYKKCRDDVDPKMVGKTVDYLQQQLEGQKDMTSKSGNLSQVLRAKGNGGEGGKGITYLVNIGWIPGCTTYAKMSPMWPVGKDQAPGSAQLLQDCYGNCKGNSGLGGFVDVGCLRYGFYPNQVKGVYAAQPAPTKFWNQYPNIC